MRSFDQTEVDDMVRYVISLGMPSGTTNPLVNQLQAALNSSVGGNHVACVKMNDFLGMVNKKGGDIPLGSPESMTAQAKQIVVVLACPTVRHPPAGADGTGY